MTERTPGQPVGEPQNPLLVAVLATIVLGVVKLAVAIVSGSTAVLASATDSLTDAAVSGLNLWTMRQAAMPADDGHPYGHGKAEALASLAQALVLAGLVVGIAYTAGTHLLTAVTTPISAAPAIAAMLFSMAGSFGISTFLSRAATRTGSLVLRSDAVHYRMDLYTGAAVLLGLVITLVTGEARADAVASLLVCGLMAKDVLGLLRDAVGELMDRPLPDEERAVVEGVLDSFAASIVGWHDLRTRRAGPSRFAQVHLVLPADMRLIDAHALAHEVERAVAAALPGLQVLVHVDAEGAPDDD
ncbi:MAG: cation diffusion facilitator family transporter [Pseudomonadota bacterium]|nr:cation diffusion facilitator family transporter [Pseudomonadota bacterium]